MEKPCGRGIEFILKGILKISLQNHSSISDRGAENRGTYDEGQGWTKMMCHVKCFKHEN